MSTPKQPDDHPPPEAPPPDPHGQTPNGVPEKAGEAEATGLPHSDRESTENAAKA